MHNIRPCALLASAVLLPMVAHCFGGLAEKFSDGALPKTCTMQRFRRDENISRVQWLPCASSANMKLHNFTGPSHKAWRDPPLKELCCFPANQPCFRAVLDGRISMLDGTDAASPHALREFLKKSYVGQVHKLLEDEFHLQNLHVSGAVRKEYFAKPTSKEATQRNWTDLHADYYENGAYVFTTLLYLGEEEADSVKLRGGETGIADGLEYAKDSTISATSAWVIEPKRGRVVIFTGGGENYHAPLPVVKGRRTTWNTWFSCECSMSDALVDDNE